MLDPNGPLIFQALVEEVGPWARKNFGPGNAGLVALGIIEEIGELAHAHLKGEQGIRHTQAEILAMKRDALGDAVIFMADVASIRGLCLGHSIDGLQADAANFPPKGTGSARLLAIAAANAAGLACLASVPGGAIHDRFYDVLVALCDYAHSEGINLSDAVRETWTNTVSKRDWKSSPATGAPPS